MSVVQWESAKQGERIYISAVQGPFPHNIIKMDTPPNTYALLMPNAPRKRQVKTIYDGEVEPLQFDEEIIIISDDEEDSSDTIRAAFLSVSPKDVMMERCIETLRSWLDLFSPSSQPRNQEEFDLVDVMYRLITKRIAFISFQ